MVTLRRSYISTVVVGRQLLQSSSTSHRRVAVPQRRDRLPLNSWRESHLLRPANLTLTTLAGKACCDLHPYARLCYLHVLEEGNCVATSATSSTNHKQKDVQLHRGRCSFFVGSPLLRNGRHLTIV